MTTREKAHRLLDALPESQVGPVLEFIVSRSESSNVDAWGDLSKLHRAATAATMQRLKNEERVAGHDPW